MAQAIHGTYGVANEFHGFVSDGSMKIEVTGIEEMKERLNRLQSKHPRMKKDLNKIMKYVIKQAQKSVLNSARSELGNDPRQAYRAVRSLVYKRIFGGNVNIISKRSRGKYVASIPENPPRTGVGGNRMQRGSKTIRMMSYWGEDRGFILRFINNGTVNRRVRTSTNRKVNKLVGRGHTSASLEGMRTGNRGRIAARNWFGPSSIDAMYKASEELTRLIDEAIEQIWGEDTITNDIGSRQENTSW